jgi:hypothetical protein
VIWTGQWGVLVDGAFMLCFCFEFFSRGPYHPNGFNPLLMEDVNFVYISVFLFCFVLHDSCLPFEMFLVFILRFCLHCHRKFNRLNAVKRD